MMSTFTSIPVEQAVDVTRASAGFGEISNGDFTPFMANQARITKNGLLVEPSAVNISPYFQPYSDTSLFGAQRSAGATRIDVTWLGIISKAIEFTTPQSAGDWTYVYIDYEAGKYRASAYVRASDGSAITVSTFADSGADCTFYINNAVRTDLELKLVDASIGLYKVSLTAEFQAPP